MDSQTGSDATGRDETRQVATSADAYTLSIEEAATRYEVAGHPRTLRSVQRYCAQGHLDCLRQETTFGVRYKITPESVARHIAQIVELASATGRDESRQVATGRTEETQPTLGGDEQRQGATGSNASPPFPVHHDRAGEPPTSERYVARLEDEVLFLRGQIKIKDEQIVAHNDRARETNVLIQGMQQLVLALQAARNQPPQDGSPAT